MDAFHGVFDSFAGYETVLGEVIDGGGVGDA
jgi:hypothetical protein